MTTQLHGMRSYLAGLLSAALLVTPVSSKESVLTEQSISVHLGNSVYIDDIPFHAPDAPIFVYENMTYVPLRPLANALGKSIQYDTSTHSVYLGDHRTTSPAVLLQDLDYFYGKPILSTGIDDRDNDGNWYAHAILANFGRTYRLHGQYSKLVGTVYQRYSYRSNPVGQGSGLRIYGDNTLLYACTQEKTAPGFVSNPFEVDLTGVNELKVLFYSWQPVESFSSYPLALGDCRLFPSSA